MKPAPPGESSFRQVRRTGNFRLLWAAGALSAVGDQFDLIAFPWLVLMLTGDPLAVGAVIAVSHLPAVFFMLLGGSLVDRFSPRRMLQASNLSRVALATALAALILSGLAQLWIIYAVALLKGLADAFYYPAQGALLPRIVPAAGLRQANAALTTTTELSGFIGPTLAGGLIAFFSSGTGAAAGLPGPAGADGAGLAGVGLAFGVVGLAFGLSSLLLLGLRLPPPAAGEEDGEKQSGVLKSIVAGLRFVRGDAAMLTMFILIAAAELFVEGPAVVGIPVLADTRLGQSALALGVLSSAYAGGALGGALLAGMLPAPKRGLGPALAGAMVLSGLLLMPFGFLDALWQGALALLLIGAAGGYVDIMLTTWLQARTPPRMLGRVMSMLMVAAVGLSPLSNAGAGALIRFSLGWVFVGAGAALALTGLLALSRREIRHLTMPESALPENDTPESDTPPGNGKGG